MEGRRLKVPFSLVCTEDQSEVVLFLLERDRAALLFGQRRIDAGEELPLVFAEIENFEAAVWLPRFLQFTLNADQAFTAV